MQQSQPVVSDMNPPEICSAWSIASRIDDVVSVSMLDMLSRECPLLYALHRAYACIPPCTALQRRRTRASERTFGLAMRRVSDESRVI